jgi:predicted aspartyl protease
MKRGNAAPRANITISSRPHHDGERPIPPLWPSFPTEDPVPTRLLALAITILGATTDRPVYADGRFTVFDLGGPGEILVSVRVDGKGPFPFLLDTGSTHSAIVEELAVSLGSVAVATTVTSTPIGQQLHAVVRLDRLELGSTLSRQLLASVVKQAALDPGGHIRGIVGQDVLADRHYTIDYRRRRLVWHEPNGRPSRSQEAAVFPLAFERERFVVDLPQPGGTLRFVPDSGAAGLVLFDRGQRALPRLSPANGSTLLSTLAGDRLLPRLLLPALEVGTTTLRDIPAVIVAQDDDGGRSADGLLPLHLFARVTFNGPASLLVLDP